MALTNFFIDQGEDEFDGAVAIICDDGKERVLTLVEIPALDDYFGWPWSLADKRNPNLAESDWSSIGILPNFNP